MHDWSLASERGVTNGNWRDICIVWYVPDTLVARARCYDMYIYISYLLPVLDD